MFAFPPFRTAAGDVSSALGYGFVLDLGGDSRPGFRWGRPAGIDHALLALQLVGAALVTAARVMLVQGEDPANAPGSAPAERIGSVLAKVVPVLAAVAGAVAVHYTLLAVSGYEGPTLHFAAIGLSVLLSFVLVAVASNGWRIDREALASSGAAAGLYALLALALLALPPTV